MLRFVGSLSLLFAAACSPAPDTAPSEWCEAEGQLDLTCNGEHCVAGVIMDYKRLEPRGYRVFSLHGTPVTKKTVEAACVKHVTEVLGAAKPDKVDADQAGDFFNCFLLYSAKGDSWLVTVHAPSGQVVFAGLEIWANPERGKDPPIPEGWSDPDPIGCEEGALDPIDKKLRTTGIPMGTAPASTAREAWDTAKGLNLTKRFTAGYRYRVMVVSFSEATGEFDPRAADWYVWIALKP
jgi:hypothetical protein